MTIHEGKKRQVRLMLSLIGNPVIKLKRLRQGPILLANLRSADWRHLTPEEVEALKAIRPQETMPTESDAEAPASRPARVPRKPEPKRPAGRRDRGTKAAASRDARRSHGAKQPFKPNFGFRPPSGGRGSQRSTGRH